MIINLIVTLEFEFREIIQNKVVVEVYILLLIYFRNCVHMNNYVNISLLLLN